MKFDPKNHKAIIKSLRGDEVNPYCDFLTGEILRHWGAIADDELVIEYCQATIQLHKSAIIRHKEDIDRAEQSIKEARRLKC